MSRQATVAGRHLWHGGAPQSSFMVGVFVKYRLFFHQRDSLKSSHEAALAVAELFGRTRTALMGASNMEAVAFAQSQRLASRATSMNITTCQLSLHNHFLKKKKHSTHQCTMPQDSRDGPQKAITTIGCCRDQFVRFSTKLWSEECPI